MSLVNVREPVVCTLSLTSIESAVSVLECCVIGLSAIVNGIPLQLSMSSRILSGPFKLDLLHITFVVGVCCTLMRTVEGNLHGASVSQIEHSGNSLSECYQDDWQ